MLTSLLLLFLSVLPTPVFHHKGMESGLSQLTINGLYQDENGTLWVGTRNGVKYYDGTSFLPLIFPEQSSWVMSNLVPTVCGDGNGSIFINTDYSVVRYDLAQDKTETLFSQTRTSSPPDISIHFGPSGLWVGCANRIYLWTRKTGLQNVASLKTPGASISSMLEHNGTLYIGTRKDGLLGITGNGKENLLIGPCSEVITLFVDSAGHVWCGTFEHGAYSLDGTSISNYSTTSRIKLSSNYIRTFSEDNYGRIWIGTSHGVDIIDPSVEKVTHCGLSTPGHPGLSNLSVWSLLRDKQGNMWIGSYYGGLDYCSFSNEVFSFENFGLTGGNGYPLISDAAVDRRGIVWLATESNALIRYDGKSWRFMRELPFARYNIKDLLMEKDSTTLWVSTHMGGLWRYNTVTGQSKHFTINNKDMTARSESLISAGKFGRHLLIGTLQGVYWVDPESGQINPVPEVNRYIYEADRVHVCADSVTIWLSGNTLCRYTPGNGVVEDYSDNLKELTGGAPITLISIAENSSGDLYVGTAGYGLLSFDRQNNRFIKVKPRKSNFPSQYISCIYPSRDGYLLLGTDKGLCRYNPSTGFVYLLDNQSGFPLVSMLPGCISDNRGQLFLGGVNGLAVTTECLLSEMQRPQTLSFSRLLVNNQPVRPGDSSGILSKALRLTEEITLSHRQNELTFHLGTDHPAAAEQVNYLFQLEGLDKEWTLHSLKEPIHYEGLAPGTYHLLIGQVASPDEVSLNLDIRIRPPFYSSWYAWTLYALLLLGIAAFVFYFFLTKFKLTTSLALERKNQEETEKLNKQKLRFFANMSHELRTPLTLIMGHLELLKKSSPLMAKQREEVDMAYRTAEDMVDMVRDQLSFIKMEEGGFQLHPVSGDLVSFVSNIIDDFQVLARQKSISLSYTSSLSECKTSFDRGNLKKVFYNLLSNAFKYTKEEIGIIRVNLGQDRPGEVFIRITDNGIGIDENSVGKVFERFYQSDNAINRDASMTGAGIGLSMASEIISMHKGRITLNSKEGQGSTFTVFLPVLEDAVPSEAVVSETVLSQNDVTQIEPTSSKKRKLLLVEDDEALRNMLVEVFQPQFKVLVASNGKEGLMVAERESPDLIISDIMMPVMTGDVFCRNIKSNFDTSHIPVILLTALADVQDSIHGFNCGADDYITKPFNIELLVARSIGLLNNRALLQKRFSSAEQSDPQMLTENNEDIEFIGRLIRLIEDNIFDKNISVSYLCEQLAMGHTKLFNKIKGLTGRSPQELILSVKIKYAARMLREQTSLNVSDIAYQLGYNSLNYFGKCFKSAFGMSPSAYRKEHVASSEK